MGIILTKKKQLSDQDLEFLKKNTKFSEERIKRWYAGFQKDCPKNRMNSTQFLNAYEALFPAKWQNRVSDIHTAQFLNFVFEAFDQDKNGQLEFREFLMFVNMMSDGNPEEKLVASFKIFDLDGNGSISKLELFKVVKGILILQIRLSGFAPVERLKALNPKLES